MDNQWNQQTNEGFAAEPTAQESRENAPSPAASAPTEPTQNGYAQPQTHDAQNSYAQSPYANHNQNGGYVPNQYYGAYSNTQGYSQKYRGQAVPPYTPPRGYYYPPQAPMQNPFDEAKKAEKKQLKKCGMVHGFSVLGFSLFAVVLSFFMVQIVPNFRLNYTKNDLFHVAVDTLFAVVVIFIPFLCSYLYLRKQNYIKDLPLAEPYHWSAAVLLVFMGLAACLIGSYTAGAFNTIFETLFHVEFILPDDDVLLTSLPIVLLSVVKVAVVPALVEEFAIRGVVMQSLKKYGDWFAILMSALVFALMHGNMVQIPFAFVAGIAIGYAVTVTGSLWTGVAIHFLNNLTSLILQVFSDNLSTTLQNVLGGVLILAILAVGVACAIVYFVRFRKVPLAKGESKLSSGEKTSAYLWNIAMVLAILYLIGETSQYIRFH